MSALRRTRRALTFAAPVAAALLFTGVATAAPPQPFGVALTIGCINQASLASLTAVTAHAGPDGEAGIAPGHVRFSSREAAWPIPAANQVTVAWINRDNGRTGITDLHGTYPHLAADIDTGPGEVLATVFGSINLGSGPICNSMPTNGSVRVG